MKLVKRTQKKIVVVTRETRVDNLRKRFNTLDQAQFWVKSRGGDFSDYQREHKVYRKSVSNLEESVFEWGRTHFIDRSYLPNFVFGPDDTVVAIGQDGLVANTLKYLKDGQPLIGVNPDPERWDGVLLPFTADELPKILPDVLQRNHSQREVTMARATLNDGQELLAVNDFFIGQKTHASARYLIESAGRSERHSSSGVVVSTGLGSTGWLKSLIHGAQVLAGNGQHTNSGSYSWDAQKLIFTVREPFPSQATQANLVRGEVTPGQPLVIRSLMAENGVIFSDGIESDFVEFNSGTDVTVDISGIRGHLVVP